MIDSRASIFFFRVDALIYLYHAGIHKSIKREKEICWERKITTYRPRRLKINVTIVNDPPDAWIYATFVFIQM